MMKGGRRKSLGRQRLVIIGTMAVTAAATVAVLGGLERGQSQTGPAARYAVLERSPLPADSDATGRDANIRPGTERVASMTETRVLSVGEGPDGMLCVRLYLPRTDYQPGFEGCGLPEPGPGVSSATMIGSAGGIGHPRIVYGLVPDGIETVSIAGGESARVDGNMFALDAPTEPLVVTLTLSGPAGTFTERWPRFEGDGTTRG